MKRIATILAVSLALGGTVQAGSVAGARDGDYKAADGDLVLIASRDDRVSLNGQDCMQPVVRSGRIVSTRCWGNGHLGADLDAEWRVEGDHVMVGGKRYTRLPETPLEASVKVAASAAPSLVEPTGRPWMHNGSEVWIDPGTGIVAYSEPKASIRSVVGHGTVLFRGDLWADRPIRGTAYAFKDGCPPAPYAVTGAYSDYQYKLKLQGAAPIRRGCEVVGYSLNSPHAVLRFSYQLND